jgi:hypothetical protein
VTLTCPYLHVDPLVRREARAIEGAKAVDKTENFAAAFEGPPLPISPVLRYDHNPGPCLLNDDWKPRPEYPIENKSAGCGSTVEASWLNRHYEPSISSAQIPSVEDSRSCDKYLVLPWFPARPAHRILWSPPSADISLTGTFLGITIL